MEAKTKNNVVVSDAMVNAVATILANCNTDQRKKLECNDFFIELASSFIGAIDDDTLDKFMAHNVTIALMSQLNILNK